jgi:hypothetical protein
MLRQIKEFLILAVLAVALAIGVWAFIAYVVH